jgi:hypothetical protein
MKLINCDEELTRILSSKFTLNEDEGTPVFINWLGENKHESSEIVNQIEYLEKSIKEKRKVLVFDRDLSLKDDHIEYLSRKKNVVLCEPAINHRRSFIWLPFPIETFEDPPLRTQEKKYDFYIPSPNHPSKAILDKIKEDLYPEITFSDNYSECKCYLICDVLRKSLYGYLEPINYLLKEYCFPVIWNRHRFYHYLFRDLMAYEAQDLKWLTIALNYADYAVLKDFYIRVNTNFPEMRVENWLGKVEELLNG